MRLKDSVAIVTGGGRGIGKATCLALAREGANIVVTAGSRDEIAQVRRSVENIGSESLAVDTDIRKETGVCAMVSDPMEHFGKMGLLVNNSGVAVRRLLTG
ncbi:SDR family NAD(P)-dependent oxidoreductase [Methanolobus chelungpuianus]|uniref:SDR family NAD(P)-dependent oxidoreductase n=1 Tax=Methanolobus chelungpuianus TaxID=502115 RepID=UPI0021148406|nr:SDR family NAD(P)-dependent oxidoreductase [Methanolobus chelungpuianus]